MNGAFGLFYSQLYTSPGSRQHLWNIQSLLKTNYPKNSLGEHQDLEMPVNLTEVTTAIKKKQSGNPPAPNGYPVEFLKKFWKQLAAVLLEMFEDLLRQVFCHSLSGLHLIDH